MGGGGADLAPPMPLPPPPFSMSSGTVVRSDSVSSVMDVSALFVGMLDLPFLLLRWNIKVSNALLEGSLFLCTRIRWVESSSRESGQADLTDEKNAGKDR